MKRIVSCTIATALATTNLTTMSVEAMKSGTKVNDSNDLMMKRMTIRILKKH